MSVDLSGRVPRFDCTAGMVLGWRDVEVIRATGIRYAWAERFEPPVPEPAASQQIVAMSRAPACPQLPDPLGNELLGPYMATLPSDEHCQHLSITMPGDLKPGEQLPVMVWIHGGSYTNGAGDASIYDPAALVSEQRVVVVNITYRLGLFGFLGGWEGRPANLGLLDQIEALRWVRANISAFGGDAENVTLFGESAGGDAIAHLMIAEGTKGLFRRAIIQSAPFGIISNRAGMSRAMAREAESLNADMPVEALVAAQAAVAAQAVSYGLRGGMPFGVQYGFHPLPAEKDRETAWRAVARDIDVLVGSTEREIAFFVSADPLLSTIRAIPLIGKVLCSAAVAVATWQVYGAGVKTFARRHQRAGGRAFSYRLRWGSAKNPYASAHTSDLPLLLGSRAAWADAQLVADESWDDIEQKGRVLRRLWSGFARTGMVPATNIDGLINIQRG